MLCGNHISLARPSGCRTGHDARPEPSRMTGQAAGQVRRPDKWMQDMQHIEYHAVTAIAMNGLRVSYSTKSTLFGFLYGTI